MFDKAAKFIVSDIFAELMSYEYPISIVTIPLKGSTIILLTWTVGDDWMSNIDCRYDSESEDNGIPLRYGSILKDNCKVFWNGSCWASTIDIDIGPLYEQELTLGVRTVPLTAVKFEGV